MQTIVMTSDRSDWTLAGFSYLFDKYTAPLETNVVICGYRQPPIKLPRNYTYFKIGSFSDFPARKWSNSLRIVLDNVADETFLLMLDDYWIWRAVDTRGIKILYDYCKQFGYVLKADVTHERLYNRFDSYNFGQNTYASVGHLDLIKSPHGSTYQMSLWAGIWNRDNLAKMLVPNESAQEIELYGTGRFNSQDERMIVIGSRQAPLLHGNILQSGKDKPAYRDVGWQISDSDISEMRNRGWIRDVK